MDREINLIAGRVGLSIWDLQERAGAAADRLNADPRGATENCDSIVETEVEYAFARWRMDGECLETLGLFQKTACLSRLGDLQAASLQKSIAEAEAVASLQDTRRPDCAEPPVVYVQIGSDDLGDTVRTLTEQLRVKGWPVAGVETVTSYKASGDIRYYYRDQIACAKALAYDIADAPGRTNWREMKLIDLSQSYTNLPKGRMELWLGQGS